MIFTVALVQWSACGPDVEANARRGEEACRRARAQGADLALFPEMWSVGYTLPDPGNPVEVAGWRARAVDRADGFVRRFQDLARSLNMAVGLTLLEKAEPLPRNSLLVIDRHGEIVLEYSKVHTCDFDREHLLQPGAGFVTAGLDTAAGPLRLGAMICMDREFPESARVLMLQGAEIILTPNACEMEALRLGQFQARAYENMVGLALANYPAPAANGHSVAYDGIAFREIDGPSRDMLVALAGEEETILTAPFDLDALRAYRAREVWGDSYRKPYAYRDLLNPDARPPFQRPDSRRTG